MIFDVDCVSRTGKNPKKYTTVNQDAFSVRKTKQWCCMCIADGAGSKKHSSLGAKWLVQDICDYLIENADALLIQEEAQIRKQVMKNILNSLNKTAEYHNVALTDLSSTLICVLTNGETCLSLHLGDGVILAERKGFLNVISFPMNGSTRQSTALTTMMNAENYLRIRRESCEIINIIWLMTDGTMYEVFQENYGLNGQKLSMSMIHDKLANRNSDDATYGYIKWRKENE